MYAETYLRRVDTRTFIRLYTAPKFASSFRVYSITEQARVLQSTGSWFDKPAKARMLLGAELISHSSGGAAFVIAAGAVTPRLSSGTA